MSNTDFLQRLMNQPDADGQLVAALLAGARIDPATARQPVWARSCEAALASPGFPSVAPALAVLSDAFPQNIYFRSMRDMLAVLPEAGEDRAPFLDDPAAPVQVIRCPGSDTVMFCFCGISERLGMPLNMIHRWLARLPVHIVYLRGYFPLYINRPQSYAGSDFEGSLAGLRAIAGELGARRILCWGNSLGGYGALRYGAALGAERIMSIGGKTRIDGGDEEARRIYHGPDLRPLFEEAPGRTCLVYAEGNAIDREQALHFEGLPGATLWPFADSDGHNVIFDIIRAGRFDELLDWMRPEAGAGLSRAA